MRAFAHPRIRGAFTRNCSTVCSEVRSTWRRRCEVWAAAKSAASQVLGSLDSAVLLARKGANCGAAERRFNDS